MLPHVISSSEAWVAWSKAVLRRLKGISQDSAAFAPSLHGWMKHPKRCWRPSSQHLLIKLSERIQDLLGSHDCLQTYHCIEEHVGCDWSGLGHRLPLRQGGWFIMSDSPTRICRVEEGKHCRGGVLAGERLPLQGNEWQSVCYSGNHSSRALLSSCQINDVSHCLELLALLGNMQNKNCSALKK